MKIRHVLSILDVSPDELMELVERAVAIAANGGTTMWPLMGGTVGIYFRCSSTRTRTSFTVAAHRLGAETIHYGPNDLQLVTGESISDTARVLSGFLNALVIRTNQSISEMELFASQHRMPIINAMSENEHPTQAIADLVTIEETFGRLQDVGVLYVGEGNNTASALALAVALTPGMRLMLLTPEGYGLSSSVLEKVRGLSRESGSVIEQHHDISSVRDKFDVVYTTRWQTMGDPKSDSNWKEKFKPYSVTQEFMQRFSKDGSTVFMHDLPAVRGDDVVDEVLDGPQSVAFRQARHKLTSAMAVLEWCMSR